MYICDKAKTKGVKREAVMDVCKQTNRNFFTDILLPDSLCEEVIRYIHGAFIIFFSMKPMVVEQGCYTVHRSFIFRVVKYSYL